MPSWTARPRPYGRTWPGRSAGVNEFDLIAQFFTRAPRRPEIVLGVGDDAALLAPEPGTHLVVSTDTLIEGVHFAAGAPAFDVGYKALAVNVSDLAAMAARPIGFLLNLTLPQADAAWLGGFRDGLFALADSLDVDLIGGDTVRGPLAVTITAWGASPAGTAVRRSGARPGDRIYVSGRLGEAALGFLSRSGAITLSAEARDAVRARLDRPAPRLHEGLALRGLASAMIDISDGLVADLGHILEASAVGAEVDLHRLPLSDTYKGAFATLGYDPAIGFGDDYELCFTVPPDRGDALAGMASQFACGFHDIGEIVAAPGLILRDGGKIYTAGRGGYDHFRS